MPCDLNIRPPGKARIRLEQRSDPFDLSRISLDDRVRVSDRDRHELNPLEPLRRTDLYRPQLLLDQPALDQRPGHAFADPDAHLVGACALGEPAGGDSRSVSGQLGPGAVWVPNRDLRGGPVDGDHLEHAVGVVRGRELARALRRQPLVLCEQVDVPVRGPLRESHRQPQPAGGRPRR